MSSYEPMPRHLTTERLTLRPWDDSYAEALRHLHAERGDGTPPLERTREVIANGLAASAETRIALLPVHRRAEGDFIGYCGLTVNRSTVEEPEIAFELFQRVHGNGYATEAARAVLDAAAATGRTRLWATVRTWNAASFRVLDKLGFERDHVTADERGDIVWLTRTLP
jgi:RimJ/RimL family protein N-acetyltransferase